MIPVSLSWDTTKRSIWLKWNGLFSLGWENGRISKKIFGFAIPFRFRQKRIPLPMRWVYLKGFFSFLTKWKLEKLEGTLSFPDPMVNGLLYGWFSIMESRRAGRKINVTINFLGENRLSGEAALPLKTFFHHLKRWVFLLLQEERERRL